MSTVICRRMAEGGRYFNAERTAQRISIATGMTIESGIWRFWLGLDKIHRLVVSGATLRVDQGVC